MPCLAYFCEYLTSRVVLSFCVLNIVNNMLFVVYLAFVCFALYFSLGWSETLCKLG